MSSFSINGKTSPHSPTFHISLQEIEEITHSRRSRNVESYTPPALSDFEARLLAPGVALVTYKTTRRASPGQPASAALRSSLWVERENRWQVIFHQGTKTVVLNGLDEASLS